MKEFAKNCLDIAIICIILLVMKTMSMDQYKFDCTYRLLLPPKWTQERGKQLFTHHKIILVKKGVMRSFFGDKSLVLKPGYAGFYPHGFSHTHQVTSDTECEIIVLCWQGVFSELPGTGPRVVRDKDQRILHQAEWCLELHPARNATESSTLHALLTTICQWFCRQLNPEPIGVFESMRAYMREHLHEKVMLEHLSVVVGMSKYHLIHICKKHLGYTPGVILEQLRFEKAQTLILRREEPLEYISHKVGLVNGSYLARIFKKHSGRTPREFRRDPLI